MCAVAYAEAGSEAKFVMVLVKDLRQGDKRRLV
jgi:hypothetical protein